MEGRNMGAGAKRTDVCSKEREKQSWKPASERENAMFKGTKGVELIVKEKGAWNVIKEVVRSYKVAFLISPPQQDWRLKLSKSLYLGSFSVHYRILAAFLAATHKMPVASAPCLVWQSKMSPSIAKYLVVAKSSPVENHWNKDLESHVKQFGLSDQGE